MPIFTPEKLREVGQRVFAATGASREVAQRVAHALVDANLAGHDSHGVIRIPQYVEHVHRGEFVPGAEAKVIRETTLAVLVDGGWGFGQVTAELATQQAVARAKQHGLGAAGAVRCTHIGRLGEYAEMAARDGIIAFVSAEGFARGVEETLARVKSVPPAPGFDEVLIPGEPEARSRAQRQRDGIEVEQATVDAIRVIGASLNITADQLL